MNLRCARCGRPIGLEGWPRSCETCRKLAEIPSLVTEMRLTVLVTLVLVALMLMRVAVRPLARSAATVARVYNL